MSSDSNSHSSESSSSNDPDNATILSYLNEYESHQYPTYSTPEFDPRRKRPWHNQPTFTERTWSELSAARAGGVYDSQGRRIDSLTTIGSGSHDQRLMRPRERVRKVWPVGARTAVLGRRREQRVPPPAVPTVPTVRSQGQYIPAGARGEQTGRGWEPPPCSAHIQTDSSQHAGYDGPVRDQYHTQVAPASFETDSDIHAEQQRQLPMIEQRTSSSRDVRVESRTAAFTGADRRRRLPWDNEAGGEGLNPRPCGPPDLELRFYSGGGDVQHVQELDKKSTKPSNIVAAAENLVSGISVISIGSDTSTKKEEEGSLKKKLKKMVSGRRKA